MAIGNLSRLLLVGIAINALCGAAVGVLSWLSNDQQLRQHADRRPTQRINGDAHQQQPRQVAARQPAETELVTLLIFSFSRLARGNLSRLLLVGIAINALCGAAVGVLLIVAQPRQHADRRPTQRINGDAHQQQPRQVAARPLADPGLLGISSGAGLAVALAIIVPLALPPSLAPPAPCRSAPPAVRAAGGYSARFARSYR
jgi:ABC-type Fe3+-siderophore transport system permease subunit